MDQFATLGFCRADSSFHMIHTATPTEYMTASAEN